MDETFEELNLRGLRAGKPIQAPFSCRNNSEAIKSRGVAAQFTLTNVLDHAFFVDHKGRALGEPDDGYQDAVLQRNGLPLVTQDGERDAERFGESLVPGRAVNADSDHLRFGLLEPGDISLIRLELSGSTRCERPDVEGQHNTFLAAKVAQLHGGAVLVWQREVRRLVADLEGGRLRLHQPTEEEQDQSSTHEDSPCSHGKVHNAPTNEANLAL